MKKIKYISICAILVTISVASLAGTTTARYSGTRKITIQTDKAINLTAGTYSGVVPKTGYYVIQLRGGGGGGFGSGSTYYAHSGGLGGYVEAIYKLERGKNIYLGVAGNTGNYNSGGIVTGDGLSNDLKEKYKGGAGGAGGKSTAGGGGAATVLQYGESTTYNRDEVLMVAGGGGGCSAGGSADTDNSPTDTKLALQPGGRGGYNLGNSFSLEGKDAAPYGDSYNVGASGRKGHGATTIKAGDGGTNNDNNDGQDGSEGAGGAGGSNTGSYPSKNLAETHMTGGGGGAGWFGGGGGAAASATQNNKKVLQQYQAGGGGGGSSYLKDTYVDMDQFTTLIKDSGVANSITDWSLRPKGGIQDAGGGAGKSAQGANGGAQIYYIGGTLPETDNVKESSVILGK